MTTRDLRPRLCRAGPRPARLAAAGTALLLVLVAAAASGDNRVAVTRYLGVVAGGAPPADVQALLDALAVLDPVARTLALDVLHPEAYDAQASSLLALGERFAGTMLERPRHCIGPAEERRVDPRTGLRCRPRHYEPWLGVYGHVRSREGAAGQIDYDDDAAGLVLGLDRRFGRHWLVSGAVGSAYDVMRVERVGKGRLSTLDLGLLAGYHRGALRLNGLASYSHGWHRSYRNIRIPGLARSAEGVYDSDRVGARLDAAWDFALGRWRLSPLASVDYAALFRPMLDESGAGAIGLRIDAGTDHVVGVRGGLELGAALRKDAYWTDWLESLDGLWRPSLALRWRQVVDGSERSLTSAFLGTPTAGRFRIRGDDADRGFEVGAGLDFSPELADRVTLGVRYDAFLWESISSHDFSARVRFSF